MNKRFVRSVCATVVMVQMTRTLKLTTPVVTAVILVFACITSLVVFSQESRGSQMATEYEASVSKLFGIALAPEAIQRACAILWPELAAQNESPLRKCKTQNAVAVKEIQSAAHELLLAHAKQDAAQVDLVERKPATDMMSATLSKLRPDSAKSIDTCRQFASVLSLPEWILDRHPLLEVIREQRR